MPNKQGGGGGEGGEGGGRKSRFRLNIKRVSFAKIPQYPGRDIKMNFCEFCLQLTNKLLDNFFYKNWVFPLITLPISGHIRYSPLLIRINIP